MNRLESFPLRRTIYTIAISMAWLPIAWAGAGASIECATLNDGGTEQFGDRLQITGSCSGAGARVLVTEQTLKARLEGAIATAKAAQDAEAQLKIEGMKQFQAETLNSVTTSVSNISNQITPENLREMVREVVRQELAKDK